MGCITIMKINSIGHDYGWIFYATVACLLACDSTATHAIHSQLTVQGNTRWLGGVMSSEISPPLWYFLLMFSLWHHDRKEHVCSSQLSIATACTILCLDGHKGMERLEYHTVFALVYKSCSCLTFKLSCTCTESTALVYTSRHFYALQHTTRYYSEELIG